MSHKHTHCEVISGVSYPLLERMYLLRGTLSSVAFRRGDRQRGRADGEQPVASAAEEHPVPVAP